MLILMAWRNIWRNKRRSLITSFSVALGVFLAVTFTASGDYGYTNIINTSAAMGYGHVTIEPKGYNNAPSLDKVIPKADLIRSRVIDADGVVSASVKISGQAMFATASRSIGGAFLAVYPDQEGAAENIFIRSIIEGELFDGPDGIGVVIGQKMAEKLDLKIGKKLIYTMTDINGEIVGQIARVTGIYKTGVDEVDSSMVILPIDRVRKTLGYGEGDATMISIFSDDSRRSLSIRDSLRDSIDGSSLDILTWQETQADIAGMITVDRTMNYLSQLLFGVLIAAGILNTMLMSVLEQKREFGVMLAVGLPPWRLFLLVVVESLIIGVIGLILGIIITTPWYIYMSRTGIDLGGLMEEGTDVGGVLHDTVMKFRLYKESAIAILAGVFSLTILAGLYPAYKAGRIPPVESIKEI
ncbi:MAG: FtsX-like permease family protein [Nitrospinota bacterium]